MMYWKYLLSILVAYTLFAYLTGVEIEDIFSSMLIYSLGYIQGGSNMVREIKE